MYRAIRNAISALIVTVIVLVAFQAEVAAGPSSEPIDPCKFVLCPAPVCFPGEVPVVPRGQCCAICVPEKTL
ncbi:MAG: hypothetical protein AAGA48_34925 [Myxococcota bacterium]